MRIASLLASSTEIVAALDLTDDLVAVSHCCDWPPQVRDLPALTSALFEAQTARDIDEAVRAKLQGQDAIYALDAQALAALKPDLVISQALCDVCAVSGAEVSTVLSDLDPQPTLVNLEPYSLRDILETITMIGEAAGVADRAAELRASLQARIDAVAALYGNLSKAHSIDTVDARDYLSALVEDIVTASGREAQVTLEINIDRVALSTRIAVPLGLIVNEVVTNSMKYAFEGRDGGVLGLRLDRAGPGLEIAIWDDGGGIDPDADAASGLGQKMTEAFSEQLGGTLARRSDASGTRYTLAVPHGDAG